MSANVMEFVSGLFKAKEQNVTRDHKAWRQLIRDVAAGKEKSADETLAKLDRLGKSPADLQTAIVQFQRRKTLAAKLAAVDPAAAELKRVSADQQKAIEALQAEEEKYQPRIDQAAYRIRQLEQLIAEGQSARNDLLSSGNDPLVEARIAGLRQEINQMTERIINQKDLRHRIGDKLLQAKANRADATDSAEAAEIEGYIAEVTGRYSEATEALAELEAHHKDLYAQMEQERESYLDPACIV